MSFEASGQRWPVFPHSCSLEINSSLQYHIFLSSRMRSVPAEEQTGIQGVYGSEVWLWNTEQRTDMFPWPVSWISLHLLSCQTEPSVRGTPSSTMACQPRPAVFLARTVQKFPLRDANVIPSYIRERVSHAVVHPPQPSVSVGWRPQARWLPFSFPPSKYSNLVPARLHLIAVFIQHLN